MLVMQAVGLTSQRTRFVPIPQSALSSNQGSRGQAKPPQPVPLTAARTNNQLKASTQPTAEYPGPAVGNAATPAAVSHRDYYNARVSRFNYT